MAEEKEYRLETRLQDDIFLTFGSHPDIRIWRCNTGLAYGYSQVNHLIGLANKLCTMVDHGAWGEAKMISAQITALNMGPTKYGTKGAADVQGLASYENKSGSAFARFISIEAKIHPRKATDDQVAWGKMVESRGGIWILAYSLSDIRSRLKAEGFDV